jgi:peptidoglycan/LPS O-acetylase OafA/YrhL
MTPSVPKPTAETRVPALTGLRAVAIAPVVLLHAFQPVTTLFQGGWIGVDVFFALSGYLITNLLLREIQQRGRVSIREFYLRRILRLWPALFVIAAIVLVVFTCSRFYDWRLQLHTVLLAVTFRMNFAKAGSWTIASGLGHTWTLAVEEQFYVVWAVIVWIAAHCRRPLRVMVPFTLLGIGVAVTWRYVLMSHHASISALYFSPLRVDAILVGCLAAEARAAGWSLGRVASRIVQVIAAIGALTIFFFVPFTDRWLYAGPITAIDLVAALVVVSLADGPRRNWTPRFLEWPAVIWLGEISYSLYLCHLPILWGIGLLHYGPFVVRTCIGIVLAVVAAAASRRYIELPFLQLRGKMRERRTREVGVAARNVG